MSAGATMLPIANSTKGPLVDQTAVWLDSKDHTLVGYEQVARGVQTDVSSPGQGHLFVRQLLQESSVSFENLHPASQIAQNVDPSIGCGDNVPWFSRTGPVPIPSHPSGSCNTPCASRTVTRSHDIVGDINHSLHVGRDRKTGLVPRPQSSCAPRRVQDPRCPGGRHFGSA